MHIAARSLVANNDSKKYMANPYWYLNRHVSFSLSTTYNILFPKYYSK